MKNLIKNTVIGIFLCVLICCTSERKNVSQSAILTETGENELIKLECSYESSPSLPFDSLMSDVFYVKLETTANNLVGEISQILFAQDKIIVVDRTIAKSVTVYDKSGKFLNQIGQLGQGPREYNSLYHVCLTPDSTMLVIIDFLNIKYYTLDGQYIKTQRHDFSYETMEFMSNDTLVFYHSMGLEDAYKDVSVQPTLMVSDLSGNAIYSSHPSLYKENIFMWSTWNSLYKYGNMLYFNPSGTDTIYVVTSSGLYPKYQLQYKGVPRLKIDENMTDKILDDYQLRYPWFGGEFVELDNAFYFTYYTKKIPWHRFFLYSKSQNQVYTCNSHLYNPFFYAWHGAKARYKEDYLVGCEQSWLLMKRKEQMLALEKNLPPEKRPLLHALFFDLTEDDNPVLFFFRVKI